MEKNPWAGTALIVPYEAMRELQIAAGRTLPTDEDRFASVCALLASCDRMLKWLAAASKEGARGALRAHNGLRRFKQLRRELEASFESVPPRSTDDTGLSLIAQAAMNLRTTGHDMGPNDVCIDKQAVEKLRRGTELVRVELQEREAKAAEDAATTSPRRRPKRGGRPAVTDVEARKREALVAEWEKAKAARTGQKQFCEDAGISLRELNRAINWLTQRRRRNGA